MNALCLNMLGPQKYVKTGKSLKVCKNDLHLIFQPPWVLRSKVRRRGMSEGKINYIHLPSGSSENLKDI